MAYSDMKFYLEEVNGRKVPVYYPQYWDEDLQDWVVTSKVNGLPVTVNNPQESVSVSNLPSNQQTTITNVETNAIPTKLTRSKTEVVEWDSAKPITEAESGFHNPRDTSKRRARLNHLNSSIFEQSLFVLNDLDADVLLSIVITVPGQNTELISTIVFSETIGSDVRAHFTPNRGNYVEKSSWRKVFELPELGEPHYRFRIEVTPVTAPTKGEIYFTSMRRF